MTKNNTILVTGGAGFIGSHIVDAYLDLGYKVIIADNLYSGKKSNLNPKAKFINIDIRNNKAVEKLIATYKPTIINHHAAQKSVTHSVDEPSEDLSINGLGLINLLESGRRHNLQRFIFASTGGAIYGDTDRIPTPEGNPTLPASPYGITKMLGEHYLRFYCDTYGIEHVVLRYSNVFGPRQDPYGEAGVIAIFVKKVIGHEAPTIFGDGLNSRDYVYVGDVARANVSALTAPLENSALTLNIGTGTETDVNTLYSMVTDVAVNHFRLEQIPLKAKSAPGRAGEQRRSCLNNTKAQQIIGWQPSISLTEGIILTTEYFLNEKN